MAGVAIVAIPREDDPVWKVSSEKIPHLTILFLGSNPANIDQIVNYTEHAAETSLTRFGLDVDRRGLLGPEDADVLFFSDAWDLKRVKDFRSYLLKDNNIKTAYDSATQFPEWTPHLTLGFPATPAKPDNRDYPGINWVSFDKIAVWTENYAGPTFELEVNMTLEPDMAMSDVIDNILEHHGVKGMKWGVRKDRPGSGHPTHPDAAAAKTSHQKARRSGVSALSNEELKSLNKRLGLEAEFKRLNTKPKSDAQKLIEEELKRLGRQHLPKLAAKAAMKVGAAVIAG